MTLGTKNLARSQRRHLFWGFAIIALLIVGVGGWASTANISGAVIASGSIVVGSNVKTIQHADGGIVGEILASDGDMVIAGDVVVRLDGTKTKANLAINTKAIDNLLARRARLRAELEGLSEIEFPQTLIARSNVDEVAEVLRAEESLFKIRRSAVDGQKSQLKERIVQFEQEIIGLKAEATAKSEEAALIDRELVGARDLFTKGLIQITKLTDLERQAARLEGEGASLDANIARTQGRISETRMQVFQIDRDLSSQAASELGEIAGLLGELQERQITAQDQLNRIDIRAPQDGVVHQSTVHTVGGVIGAGQEIMLIVPRAESLLVEAKILPQDIDQLYIEQDASLRFTAFNQQSTPEIYGNVERISADVTTDERTDQSFYTIRIGMSAEEVGRLGDVTLVPGMPVEAFIQTEARSVLSYLMKPLSDQIARAFREE